MNSLQIVGVVFGLYTASTASQHVGTHCIFSPDPDVPLRRLHAASTPPHAVPTAGPRCPHAACTPPRRLPMQPPCHLPAAVTPHPPPPRRPTPLQSAFTPPPRRPTPPPRRPHAAALSSRAASTPRPRLPHRPHAAFKPPLRRRYATALSRRNAAPAQLHSATRGLSTPRRCRPHAA